mmetsp:Transcript_18748/g.33252  ORF Transcript_18748/g.33252 Transcript_18748/m.33252 type:complete len:240 (-) Transcript_18748:790-1509(-)
MTEEVLLLISAALLLAWYIAHKTKSPEEEVEGHFQHIEKPKQAQSKVAKQKQAQSKVIKYRDAIDGKHYYVAHDLPDKETAARKLAEVHDRTHLLVSSIARDLDNGRRIVSETGRDLTPNMLRLVKSHASTNGEDSAIFAEYHNPSDRVVGSNRSKGGLIEICLRDKGDPTVWNSDNSIFRVHIHELSHSADSTHGSHGPEFKEIMRYLLMRAEGLQLYSSRQYPHEKFCGLELRDELR